MVTEKSSIDPFAAIATSLGVNKQATRILAGGFLGLFLALFIWQTMQGDPALYWQILAALIGVAFLMMILTVFPLLARRLLAWVVTLCFSAWAITLTSQVITKGTFPPGIPKCTASFFMAEICNVSNGLASNNAPVVETIQAQSSEIEPRIQGHETSGRSGSRVFIQFAGYTRSEIVTLAKALNEQEWNVQGADRGGERLEAATGLQEIRYFNSEDIELAESLALEVSALLANHPPIELKDLSAGGQFSNVKPGQLEVWISKP